MIINLKSTKQKSVNLQYNTLVRWAAGTNDSLTKRLVFRELFFFFIKCGKILSTLSIFFFLFYKITSMKIKSFECPKSIRNCEKKILGASEAWSTSRLVPSAQQTRVIDRRLLDCKSKCWWRKESGNENGKCVVVTYKPNQS